MLGRWTVAGVVGVLVASHSGAARLDVTASRSELLYTANPGTPNCSDLFNTKDPNLPFNIVRLQAATPAGAQPEQIHYQWSSPKPAVGMLAADIDLGPDEQAEPTIRTLCADLGNGCVLTEEQLSLYNKNTILWIAPGCNVLPDMTARPFRGGRVRIGVRASIGTRSVGKGSVTLGYGRLGSLELLVHDPNERGFRNGIGKPSGENIFLNPTFGARLETGTALPNLDEIKIESNGGGTVGVSPPCLQDPSLIACTEPGDVLYTSGGKHIALATAMLHDGSALCDKLAVDVRTTTIIPKLDVSISPRRKQYVPGGAPVNLRVRLHNASPPGSIGNILLVGSVLSCNTDVRVGRSTISKTTQIDLQHCSATVNQACDADADCAPDHCEHCQPGESCLTSSHCSTPTTTPIGCTSDVDCQPPRCRICRPFDSCIQVLPVKQIFLGVGDSVDLVESAIAVANTLPAPARVTDSWTVHTFNAGDDSDAVKYKIAPRPGVKP